MAARYHDRAKYVQTAIVPMMNDFWQRMSPFGSRSSRFEGVTEALDKARDWGDIRRSLRP